MNRLDDIHRAIHRGRRLSRDDGLTLMASRDINAMGQLALEVKRRKSGQDVFFNVNCHINLTNVCHSRCGFCAFSCDPGDPGAYCMRADEVVDRVRRAFTAGITEVHMVSGLHPERPLSYYVDVVRAIRQAFPRLHIKAFTAVEVQYFADLSGRSVPEVLGQLIAAGLNSLPGGGAEVLSDRVRQRLCPRKATADQWLEVMRQAHRLGLRSNATLLYGHIETPEEIIDHLLRIRALQDETGGFQTFIPLPFHPGNTALPDAVRPTAVEMLRMFSVARLMLDNIDHIKAYWIMTGLKVAQLALFFGADDVDGTVMEEKITHAAGAQTAAGVDRDELAALIHGAGAVAVERDSLYGRLSVYSPA
jgi:aminodeoxyfutalosine synthase